MHIQLLEVMFIYLYLASFANATVLPKVKLYVELEIYSN